MGSFQTNKIRLRYRTFFHASTLQKCEMPDVIKIGYNTAYLVWDKELQFESEKPETGTARPLKKIE